MAVDGSFCVEYELKRLVDRCPKLANISQIDNLLKKGSSLTEKEMVHEVAELLLHPNYTIPLVGCFSPIARNIIDRVVKLLKLVPTLRSNPDDSMVESDDENVFKEAENLDNSEALHIIDYYGRRGKGLSLHELACMAFSRALDLVPAVLGYASTYEPLQGSYIKLLDVESEHNMLSLVDGEFVCRERGGLHFSSFVHGFITLTPRAYYYFTYQRSVLCYFNLAPPPFERIKQRASATQPLAMAGIDLLNAVRVSYRLLLADPEVFSTLWDWSCFLILAQLPSDLNQGNAQFSMIVSDIRWCSIQILSVNLKISDSATTDSGLDDEEAFSCLLRWQEFIKDISLEKAGWYLEPLEENKLNSFSKDDDFNQTQGLSSLAISSLKLDETESSILTNMELSRVRMSNEQPFVLTSAMKKSFEMVLLAVSQRWPVLLYGPAGAGKTALINRLASVYRRRVLSIHMDDQIDGKTLIGNYVCAEKPGEFRWQPGSLTQAVVNGFWVVFEDIDKAPADVQSILLPLLEGASSFQTGHGEAVRIAEGFRLFSTVSSSRSDAVRATEGQNFIGALWRRVMVRPSSKEDLLKIVKTWYPDLELLSEKLIETFERVNQLAGLHFGTSGRFSLRDLLKWCKRIDGQGFHFGGDGLSAYECSSIYQEAVDIFAASSSSPGPRLTIMREIANMWAVPITAVQTLYPVDKPVIQENRYNLRVGRVTLQPPEKPISPVKKPFVEIRNSLHVLERIACSVKSNEPVLLVGETGTGKTTLVQNLASRLGQTLTVLNLSQQSDVADLLGGFKPASTQSICVPLYKEFGKLFRRTFSSKLNEEFLAVLKIFLIKKDWNKLFIGFQNGVQKMIETGKSGSKRKRPPSEDLLKKWDTFSHNLEIARSQISSDGMLFSFVEGAFITALRDGHWILLDEVNLAPPEILQRVIGVLEEESGSLCLAERGDIDYIYRHPDFRIFACMNPATDAGKRDLPFSIRSRFTEYFVDDVLEDEDLILFINRFVDDHLSNQELTGNILRFYKAAKKESEERLQDGANQKPQYSLRSLYRALEYTKKARKNYGFQKALFDGFSMFFLTLLDEPSAKLMNQLILSHLMGGAPPPQIPFDRYLAKTGNDTSSDFVMNYVLTKSVKDQLRNLSRAIFGGRYPVLLQGPTSSGKTSLVQYLAEITGHEFVRINNHEHTDLQEYLGSYITNFSGKLVFQEGVLVKAVRNGHWIVLDELNLAPSDVLEALNRLLDDNRELYLPELCESIAAHPDFMLFATQNPPTVYGGRKMLSRAFRNRFVEIHVDEIPQDELSEILKERCKVSPSYAKKMIEVMKELQRCRQSSKVFAGRHGFITPRDLFRWADRYHKFGSSYEDLARDGYYLLAERLRDDAEKVVVQEVLESKLRVKLNNNDMYQQDIAGGDTVMDLCNSSVASKNLGNIIWTRSMRRLYFLVNRCYQLREPVLLVGETGGGKTTVCQLLSTLLGSKLHILNCHQYTETSDFLGGFYPVRERSRMSLEFKSLCEQILQSKAFIHFPGVATISSDINKASATLDQVDTMINRYKQDISSCQDTVREELAILQRIHLELIQLHQKWKKIFNWDDGPLVQAMKNGDLFLVDEISLADDSVLERLNSVLEPERKLSLPEKGGKDLEQVTSHPNFFLLATMNPGGDYGKKELSPALRNRFTELWVPSVGDLDELKSIAVEKISNPEVSFLADLMIHFWDWFNQLQTGRVLTVRDLLSWIEFINGTETSLQSEVAFLHGAFLVLLDGLTLGTGISKGEAKYLREKCLSFLLKQLKEKKPSMDVSNVATMEDFGWLDIVKSGSTSLSNSMKSDHLFGIHPFYIKKGDNQLEARGFEFDAATTCRNAMRVLRAMQLSKPVLLEGSPGVGKTSLIVALGKFSGHTVVRINLSEQTDIMDLLGSDLPVDCDEGMQFAWSDGILLQALKEGSWVLLDELNLAPQSVLEGLNAILDHRAEVFIPELGVTFKCPSSFRVFACQNPSHQGGGRKGLPKSFLNRFSKVYIDEPVEDDFLFICTSRYPSIPTPLLSKLILFNKRLHEDTMLYHKFGQDGSPWEFNLRDVMRSCEIMEGAPESSKFDCFLNTVYVQRMRTPADRREVIQLYEQIFGLKPFISLYPRVQLDTNYLVVGNTSIERNVLRPSGQSYSQLKILPEMRQNIEAVTQCVHHNWLVHLVGPSSSGKTSLLRLLAHLSGNVLNELNLSSATDISELLGCFEQYNAFRSYRLAIGRVERYISEYSCLKMDSLTDASTKREYLMKCWLAFLSSTDYHSSSTSSVSEHRENWRMKSFGSVSQLVEIVEQLELELNKHDYLGAWSFKDFNRTLKTIRRLQNDMKKRSYSVKFEWVTGLLLKAIENGEWIVLENANLCNPTVLDRINSLVEQSGSITVNECGNVDGKPVVLFPHPQFRMFLTVNPSYGEVSRAMRNRGVEICIMPPYWLLDEESGSACDENELNDVKQFLALSGIPGEKFVDSMAKAHIYAKHRGLLFRISISYLELTRWVQLFQRLLTNGNQLLWSLHISWEHTYLSSLGEMEGKNIVDHAAVSYLSASQLYKIEFSRERSLCLSGGWPAPLMLRDFVWYSKETSVKQNCLYLEFLGAQGASNSFHLALGRRRPSIDSGGSPSTYLIDSTSLYGLMYPKVSHPLISDSTEQDKFDLTVLNKMLYFAANWTIEQATESDIELYLRWFRWFGVLLQPFCPFIPAFLTLLKQEMEHSIWKCIFHCRRVLMDDHMGNMALKRVPLLSPEIADSFGTVSKSCNKFLVKAIDCVGLLRRSYHQWNSESEFDFSDKTRHLKPVLMSLRELEEKVLNSLVESPSFDVVFQLFSNLLADHILFWKGVISNQSESLIISWRFLTKDVSKLQQVCPREADKFHMESRNLEMVVSWSLRSQRSLLWVHGGHPILPCSADIYQTQQQFEKLCDSIWQPKKLQELVVDGSPVEAAVSSNDELRFIAMQGVCMSTFIMSKVEDDFNVLQQLEEMHQMLLSKLSYEQQTLEGIMQRTSEQGSFSTDLTSCCVFSPEILCRRSGLSSWLDILPLSDVTSFHLDLCLLQDLSVIVTIDEKDLQSASSSLSNRLESCLKFSLKFSSRPPTDFSPHQKILWLLGAWTSTNAVATKISSFVHEMWFKWHTSLWTHPPHQAKNPFSDHCHDVTLPDMLFQPVKTLTIDSILQNSCGIKDYSMHSLKLRVASRSIWQSSSHVFDSHTFLLSAARNLFQQIIFVHWKSFEADKYASVRSLFSSTHEKLMTEEDVNTLISLIGSSNHHVLRSSINLFIKPLLDELYLQRSSSDSLYNLGCAWLHIGGLRYNLLICCDDLDPAMKYSFKYAQLKEKIASLELEIQVRNKCVHLAGSFPSRVSDKKRSMLLDNLKAELKKTQKKIVFRSDPGKFKKLKFECDEFLKLVATSVGLIKNVEGMNIQQLADQVHNWQETATRFIERLSSEYSAYIDIIQSIQLSIYEIKLGISLVLSSALRKQFMARVGLDDLEMVLGTIYSFMSFPRGSASKPVTINIDSRNGGLSFSDIEYPSDIVQVDLKLLESLVSSTRGDADKDKAILALQLKAAVHRNILLRVAYSASNSHFMDNTSFMLMDKIFHEFAILWTSMKDQVKTRQEHEAQQYKFRPRAFKIEKVIEMDISSLGSLVENETFSEWQELVSEEESTKRNEVDEVDEEFETREEVWNGLQDSVLCDVVNIHVRLFGSMDLVQNPGGVSVSDSERLCSFMDSYTLGIRVIKDLEDLSSSSLDDKLVPEHLLRLCMEHEHKFISSRSSSDAYNFYKSSNASVMAKMVEPVVALKKRIVFLLKEWDDHPALQKIVDVTEMILAIPLSTPLAKALSGMQFLLSRVRMLQETVSKFPLSDQLQPIFDLVASWQKLELESWPALLDEVQARFDTNAGQLWFPLYSIIQQRQSMHSNEYSQATVRSLEDFMQTSSIGEFRKRLQLLFAFHGQISSGIVRGSYSSANQEENVKILYNTFGFYVQFLPTVLEHLASNRKSIDKELNELLKLCKWDRSESYLTIENSKRIRQKLKKLIQKYTDVLQQPVMLILNQEAARRGLQINIESSNRLNDTFERSKEILRVACSPSQLQDYESPLWTTTWKEKVDTTLQKVCVRETIDQRFASTSSSEVYLEGKRQVWFTIEEISTTVIDCIELWKEEKKSLGKRRALSELLKLLDSCGLSKHRSMHLEDQRSTNISSRWFLQPSYAGQHLLLTEKRMSSGDQDIGIFEKLHTLTQQSLETEWKVANEYFFKSIAAVGHLRQICLNFHKDFTLEQVTRSGSYLDHLVEIQQEQREAAYSFAERLECLKRCILPLENLFLNSSLSSEVTIGEHSFSENQDATFKCMWQQKQLFDSVCGMLHDECLLLKTVESNHSNTCTDIGQIANQICLSIEKFVPEFNKSKELLDKNLLGGGGHLVTVSVLPTHYGITKQMELFVQQNFVLLKKLEEHLRAICKHDGGGGSIRDVLYCHFEEIFMKADMISQDLQSTLEAKNQSENVGPPSPKRKKNIENFNHIGGDVSEHETRFVEAVTRTCKHIMDAFVSFGSLDGGNSLSEESLGNISKWKLFFESYVGSLQLDTLCNELSQTIHIAGNMLNHSNTRKPSFFLLIEAQLKHLYSLLDLIVTFSNGLLCDFLVMHRTVSIITHVLANTFASLYSQGFGVSTEDQLEDTKTQDATGTGMGEGAGLNDVSEQMNDEDQLLGTDEKPTDEQNASNDIPNKNDKGIEMEQDFNADTFSVSEDSGDDDNENDGDDEQLDSAMGETGADSEIVDEKLWDKEDDSDKDPKNENEKNESGPSVKDDDKNGRELRAKDDAATTDEAGELDSEDPGKQNDDDDDDGNEGPDDMENFEGMDIDKDDAFTEPTGLKLDEPNPGSDEDINMNETEGEDHMEDDVPDDHDDESGEGEKTDSVDENIDEGQTEQLTESPETVNPEDNLEKNTNSDMMNQKKKDVFESVTSDFNVDRVPNSESSTQPNGESHGMRDVAPEAQWSNSEHNQNNLTPMEGLPNGSENEISVTDLSKGAKLSENQSSQLPQVDSSSVPKSESNPYRNVGDALDGWKERVKVSADIQEKAEEATNEMEDENAKEFGFTSGLDKGTSQALGPAASDQMNGNINGTEPNDEDGDGDGGTADVNDETKMDIDEQNNAQEQIIKSYVSSLGNRNDEQKDILEVGKTQDILPEVDGCPEGDVRDPSESLVLLRKSHMNEELDQFNNLSVGDGEMGKAHNLEDMSGDTKDNATTLWRKYELLTTRLSQELTEQLRLVLEPTLASKLQGDYKTGKRINMKKVIPYLASHYRKDKMWLRRTRPNKRNYQVVIAVDDSRSMSESNCGEVAIEALVTVCRAMSQLEVGNLAVASFGKKGNVKLLHEFDQPFNGEAGVKMLSSLTFKQENTIADEPMVDLLIYLSNMMDAAVANARLPSGENPLQQLVLILADGRFHEKEKLKRYVRDLLSKKRMVAFLLLDSPEESIMDLLEASFQGKDVSFSKYLDSFPFPYYIVLKNIEALPRTVADLLRQWFELMQSMRD